MHTLRVTGTNLFGKNPFSNHGTVTGELRPPRSAGSREGSDSNDDGHGVHWHSHQTPRGNGEATEGPASPLGGPPPGSEGARVTDGPRRLRFPPPWDPGAAGSAHSRRLLAPPARGPRSACRSVREGDRGALLVPRPLTLRAWRAGGLDFPTREASGVKAHGTPPA